MRRFRIYDNILNILHGYTSVIITMTMTFDFTLLTVTVTNIYYLTDYLYILILKIYFSYYTFYDHMTCECKSSEVVW